MVCSDIDRVQMPFANGAGFTECRIDRFALRRVQRDRLALENLRIVLMPFFVWINVKRFKSIVKTINRAPLISMQPRAVTSKCDQMGERNISVVPHGRPRLIPRSDVDDQVTKIATRSLPLAVLTSLPTAPSYLLRTDYGAIWPDHSNHPTVGPPPRPRRHRRNPVATLSWFSNVALHDKLLVAIKPIKNMGDVVDRLESAAEAEFHYRVR